MTGQTISAYVDAETAAAVDAIARATGVKRANFGGRALKFYSALSEDARRAMTGIENSGTPEDKQFVMREVTRLLAIAHFEVLQRKAASEVRPEILGDRSDAAIEAAIEAALRP
jgi:hypothetical protein